MSGLFLKLLNMSISASVLIVVVVFGTLSAEEIAEVDSLYLVDLWLESGCCARFN